jgi:histone-lysine N-methyltransferase SETMAR
MDETWLYHYDPETKQLSIEWRHSGSPNPGKVLGYLDILDQDGILLTDYLPTGQAINAEYYSSLLVQLKDILKEKHRARKGHQGYFFLHNNAPAHRALATQKKLVYLGFQCLDHPPYSPDLAPSDYHLFPGLNKQLKGCHFSPAAEAIAAAETWLARQHFEISLVACKS